MKYELICACGDHVNLIPGIDKTKAYIGYCLGCDQGFEVWTVNLRPAEKILYQERNLLAQQNLEARYASNKD